MIMTRQYVLFGTVGRMFCSLHSKVKFPRIIAWDCDEEYVPFTYGHDVFE